MDHLERQALRELVVHLERPALLELAGLQELPVLLVLLDHLVQVDPPAPVDLLVLIIIS